MSLKAKALAADDLAPGGPLFVEDWDCHFWIRPLSFADRTLLKDRLMHLGEQEKTDGTGEALILIACLQDEDGQLQFDMEDLPRLKAKNAGILNWLATEAMTFNRVKIELQVETARKNLKSARSSILPFRSPGHSERASPKSAS
jgi:hypothetical protein